MRRESSVGGPMNGGDLVAPAHDSTSPNHPKAGNGGKEGHRFRTTIKNKSRVMWQAVHGSLCRVEMGLYTIAATIVGGALGCIAGVCGC